jgi:membrane protein
VQVVRKLLADDGLNSAVLLAWNLLTSIFPIALALAALSGLLLNRVGSSSDLVYRVVLSVFPQDLNAQSQAIRAAEAVRQRPGLFAILALVSFLWTASSLFGAMEQAFDRAYGVKPRGLIRQKLMALAMMLGFSVLAVLGCAAVALLPSLAQVGLLPNHLVLGPLAIVLDAVVGIAVAIVLFFLVYTIVPNRPLSLRQAWPGAILAGLLFEGLSLLFPLYAHLNGGLTQYGSYFAFLFTLLAFFYLLGLITMVGVELNAVTSSKPEPSASDGRAKQASDVRRLAD